MLARLAPVARTVSWPALAAGSLLCAALAALAPLAPAASALTRWPGIGALALCIGAACLLDDPAGATADATPTSLLRRRLLRIGLALPLLAAIWIGSLWHMTAADDAWFGPAARGALSLQLCALLALTLAGSAAALRIMPDERGGWAGAIVPLAVVAVAFVLPARWTLLALPADSGWHASQLRWAALLAIGLAGFAWASRDRARRRPRRVQALVAGASTSGAP